jgi:hypothetical protein
MNLFRMIFHSCRSRIWILVIFTAGLGLSGKAQQNQTLYFMKIPQARFMNPAIQNDCSFYLGFPGINSTYLGINNNSIGFNDIVFPGTGEQADSLITFLHPSYDVDEFLNKLKPVNQIAPEVNLTTLSLGFWSGKAYISIELVEKFASNLAFPDDLFVLALKGNDAFSGNIIDLDKMALDVMYYREFGIAYSREVSDGLTIGVRPKVLFGMGNLSLDNRELKIEIDENNLYAHNIIADASMNISFPLTVYSDNDGYVDSIEVGEPEMPGFFLDFGNPGAGIDIGATFDINDHFSVSASVIDLGFIRWKKNATNLTSKGRFLFQGFDVTPLFDAVDPGDLDTIADHFLDSLKNTFNPIASNDPYTTMLPTKVYIGGVFHLNEKVHFGLLSKATFQGKRIWPSFTASVNAEAGRFLTTSISYTIATGTYDNLGFGIGIRGGPFQFYFVTDKIIYNLSKYKFDGDNTILLPDNLSSFNFRFGLNLMFGCKPKMLTDRPLY